MLSLGTFWDGEISSFDSEKILATGLFGCAYVIYVSVLRYKRWYDLEDDDIIPTPLNVEEAHVIYNNLGYIEFPFLAVKALEFGFFKTYAIPSISKILCSTSQLTKHCAYRYDDTHLLISEFIEQHPNSGRAHLALERMNALHNKYHITNMEFLYVLSVFTVVPVHFINKYGYRCVHQKEIIASYIVWKDIGVKMGIQDIPNCFEDMEAFLHEYEEKHMRFHVNNRTLGNATVDLFLSDVPPCLSAVLHPIGKWFVYSLCDSHLRIAMGFPTPPKALELFCQYCIKSLGWFVRFCLLPRDPLKFVHRTPASDEDDLGNPHEVLLNKRRLPNWIPFSKCNRYVDGYIVENMGPVGFDVLPNS